MTQGLATPAGTLQGNPQAASPPHNVGGAGTAAVSTSSEVHAASEVGTGPQAVPVMWNEHLPGESNAGSAILQQRPGSRRLAPAAAPSDVVLTSFSETISTASAQKDWQALGLFCTVLTIVTCESHGLRPLELAAAWGTVTMLLTLGCWQALARGSYIRRRWLAVPVARLLMAGRLLAVDTMRTFGPLTLSATGTFTQRAHLMLSCLMTSGVCALITAALGMPLPPLVAVLVQVAATASAAVTNTRSCASWAELPQNVLWIEAVYRWLRPVAAPLERLQLLSAGFGHNSSQQQCTSVLAAIQFWLGLTLPTLLVVRSQCATYEAWKRGQAGRQPSPPAAEQHDSSGIGNGSHPADWQYEGTVRLLRRLSAGQLLVFLAAAVLEFCSINYPGMRVAF